jgi:spermidine synthase
LQGNRLFTVEFFEALRERLEPHGLMAVTATGSLTYYGLELARMNASLLATLAYAFPSVTVVPGDENLYLAGREKAALAPLLLATRLRERQLALQLISPEHLADRLEPGRLEWLNRTLAPLPPEQNRDHSPRLLLWHLGYRSAQFDPAAGRFLARLGRIEPAVLMGGAAAVSVLLALTGRQRRRGVLGAIAATGFGGMLLELVLVYAWQTLQGAMYQALALLMTTFMAGLALGSWLANRQLERSAPIHRLFLLGEAGMVLASLLVAAMPALPPAAATGGVLLLLALTGLVVGGQFPLAVRLVTAEGNAAAATGAVYGADLVGAWLGGMIGTVVLVPALGTVPACLVVVLLKAGTWLGVARFRSA